MDVKPQADLQRRRRGAALETAILDAAWVEILEHGYRSLTIESVATRAETSKAVLYRRWANKDELARAAIDRFLEQSPAQVPDTGTLRDDVIALLRQLNERRAGVAAHVIASLGDFYRATGTSLEDLRNGLIERQGSSMDRVIERAIERGEISSSVLTDRIARLPADLIRGELLMTSRPVADPDIIEIVDTIFLPLVLSSHQRVEC